MKLTGSIVIKVTGNDNEDEEGESHRLDDK